MTRVNARGQVTIPAQIRRQLGFGAGDDVQGDAVHIRVNRPKPRLTRAAAHPPRSERAR